MIEVQRLAKQFVQGRGRKARTVKAVDGVSLTAADACITGLLGSNGAGKTTTLRIVAGDTSNSPRRVTSRTARSISPATVRAFF